MHNDTISVSVLLLPAFCETTPMWQRYSYLCNKLPDTPISKWEAIAVRNYRRALTALNAGAK